MMYIIFLIAILCICKLSYGINTNELGGLVDLDRCTTIVVGPKASTNGPMCTHTADCANCDFRLNKVPAQDWTIGSKRPLYLYKGDYPSTISKQRGSTWHPDNLEGTNKQKEEWGNESVITGYIPQVEHTYALFEAGYGIMNEHQVAMGESTCAARFWAAPTIAGGKAMIEVREMTHIALERTTTARDAIALMGSLAEKYGFYAADWSGGDMSKGEGGEALTVVDKTEAWIFHVLADDTGTSAVWAAQRVPDDHVAVVANQFVIRHVNPKSEDFMLSSNIYKVAKRQSLWKESDGPLDFLKTFAPPRAHSPYATRRVWRVFNLVAPNNHINPFTDYYASDYPFSVKSESKLTPKDLIRIQSDHYEGTQFDLTKGLAAGPYGDPNRFDIAAQPDDNLTVVDLVVQGSYERSISLFRTSYSFVAQARPVDDILALLWFSQYAPSSSSYTPLYVSTENVPKQFSRGSLFKYNNEIAFWNFCAAGNYAARFYKFAMKDVKILQDKLFDSSTKAICDIETQIKAMSGMSGTFESKNDALISILTKFSSMEAEKTTASWKDLLPQLITKFHDGAMAENLNGSAISMKKMFYPKSWLEATDYFKLKGNTGEGVILFEPSPISGSTSYSSLIFTAISSCIISMTLGFFIANKINNASGQPNRNDYMPIDRL